MRFLREKISIVVIFIFLLAIGFYLGNAQAYYGGLGSITTPDGTAYSSNLYSGLGGSYGGLYGLSGLGGLYGGLYGLSGLGNLYGGLYGGLSGLGGLYGGSYGGLSGIGGLYGGLSGLGGLYGGLYGLSGLGSSYGGLYNGFNQIYSQYGLASLYGYGDLYNSLSWRGGLGIDGSATLFRQPQVVLPGTTTLTTISGGGGTLPNPTGLWSGTWLSYITLKGGIANFNLIYNPLTLTVSGTAALLLNKLIPIPISVSGVNTITGVTLSGSFFDPVKLVTYYAEFTCTLVSPLFMTGNYTIHDALFIETDLGEFNMDLVI